MSPINTLLSHDPGEHLALAGGTMTGDITIATTKAIKTNTGAGETLLLQAYDVDGAVYTTFITFTANNTPSMSLGAFTLGGAVSGNNQSLNDLGNVQLRAGNKVYMTTNTSVLLLHGDGDGVSAALELYGWGHANLGAAILRTPNAAVVQTSRLTVSGKVDTAVATWAATKVTGQMAVIEHHTALDTLTKEESGSIHTNLGAAGAFALTLPQDARAGDHFFFVVMAAQELRIDPGAAGAIYINGAKQADDKYISADDEAESVELVCDGNGDWVAIGAVGTWTVEV